MATALTSDQIKAIFERGSREDQERAHALLTHPFYTFSTRPDCPDEYDEQTAFVEDDTSDFAICLGGTGSGKTLAAALKTARFVKNRPPPRERCPFWIIGEKLDQVTNVCWGEKLSQLIPQQDIADIRWHDHKLRRPRSVLLKHPTMPGKIGWVLEFKSYEQGISSMKAESVGGFWCNEEIPYHLLLEIKGRCRDYNSPGWADFTPIECRDPEWPAAYDECPPGWAWYHLNTLKNPYISEDWKRNFFATVPEEMRELRTIGRFTALAGQVYKEFRKKIHVIEPFTIPAGWMRIRGIDFGFNNSFCCLWIARDPDGRHYVYDEWYRNQTLLADHAREINKRVWESQPWFGATYSDHDPQVRSELSQYGIHCTPAAKEVNAGIEYVRGKMIVQGDGKPQLFIFDKCANLIREILGYRYPDGGSIRSPSDEPMKVEDHACDALRYALYTSRIRTKQASPTGYKIQTDGRRFGVHAVRGSVT